MHDIEKFCRVSPDLQLEVTFFELLAQVALFVAQTRIGLGPGVHVLQWSDNSGTVGSSRRWLTTKQPLCWGLQVLAFWAARHQADVQVEHVPGEKNILADKISRWRRYP